MPHSKILAEHIHLRVLADRLRLMAAAPTGALPPSRWHKLLDYELGTLENTLEQHFQGEERGGYMRNIMRAHPELVARADQLLDQHAGMREQLASLIAAVDRGVDVDELRPRIEQLLAAIAAHEGAETELIQDALQLDTGEGD